jgi:translation initiation factor 2B subunit (eIF-2B alpha/beta/delta family)
MSAWEEIEMLARDRTMGAAETADRAARILPEVSPDELVDAVEALLAGHPCMAPLWRLAHGVLTSGDAATAVAGFRRELAGDSTAAFALSPALPGRILTISFSQTVVEALTLRKPRAVVCMESRPGGEGLSMAGMVSAYSDVELVDDARAIADLPAEAVLIGADAITPTAVINKVKSLELVQAAAAANLPRFVVAGSLKLVPCELPVPELFQAVPIGLFTGIALPAGLLQPPAAAERAAAVPMHRALVALSELL